MWWAVVRPGSLEPRPAKCSFRTTERCGTGRLPTGAAGNTGCRTEKQGGNSYACAGSITPHRISAAGLLIDDALGEFMIIGSLLSCYAGRQSAETRRSKQPMRVWWSISGKEEYTSGEPETYTEYTTVIKPTWVRKTITVRESRRYMYDYLSVGDRVRYHQVSVHMKNMINQRQYIYCNVCTVMNPIQNDRCKRCNNLLFK